MEIRSLKDRVSFLTLKLFHTLTAEKLIFEMMEFYSSLSLPFPFTRYRYWKHYSSLEYEHLHYSNPARSQKSMVAGHYCEIQNFGERYMKYSRSCYKSEVFIQKGRLSVSQKRRSVPDKVPHILSIQMGINCHHKNECQVGSK